MNRQTHGRKQTQTFRRRAPQLEERKRDSERRNEQVDGRKKDPVGAREKENVWKDDTDSNQNLYAQPCLPTWGQILFAEGRNAHWITNIRGGGRIKNVLVVGKV